MQFSDAMCSDDSMGHTWLGSSFDPIYERIDGMNTQMRLTLEAIAFLIDVEIMDHDAWAYDTRLEINKARSVGELDDIHRVVVKHRERLNNGRRSLPGLDQIGLYVSRNDDALWFHRTNELDERNQQLLDALTAANRLQMEVRGMYLFRYRGGSASGYLTAMVKSVRSAIADADALITLIADERLAVTTHAKRSVLSPPTNGESTLADILRPYVPHYTPLMTADQVATVLTERRGTLVMGGAHYREASGFLEGIRRGLGLDVSQLASIVIKIAGKHVSWLTQGGNNRFQAAVLDLRRPHVDADERAHKIQSDMTALEHALKQAFPKT